VKPENRNEIAFGRENNKKKKDTNEDLSIFVAGDTNLS